MAQQATATFVGPAGQDPVAAAHSLLLAFEPTQGDMLLAGQIWRSRIVQRTQSGVDVNGAPFAAYNTSRVYYFYPDAHTGRTHEQRAKQTAGRYAKTGKVGKRTPLGIRYESYAAAKAAHGRSNVDLFGMEQHPHMMNALIVKAGGTELDMSADLLSGMSELDAFSQREPCSKLNLGFYGEESERARGHNSENDRPKGLPRRHFFDASPEDLQIMKEAMGQRMMARAQAVTK